MNLKKHYFLLKALIVLALFYSCKNEETLPEGILNHDQMVQLMVDVEVLQAELKYDFSKANKKINPEPRFEKVFSEHQITKEQFNENLAYYGARPLQMKDIYVDVIAQLSEAQANLN